MEKYEKKFMELAVKLSIENIDNGGGPFGAVIVRNGDIVATGVNRVTANNDPTAHAEVSAIREACSKLKNFKLEDCEIYSSCQPCPMCLSALYWAGVKKIYFGNTKEDADIIGFSDRFIYDELALPLDRRHLPAIHIENSGAIKAFEKWASSDEVVKY
ncbi:MAG: nucleoside deaminase [Clostridium sp.]|nr:nucleoside deaminase [Prevotella sp.]MCM1428616.1 nucleoside deaminase [Clostridium sp.]MCM1475745.1 nucleoside deaminase [Muribaculaceae bacterium]